MLNYYKNLFSKYTGLLIRMDDISENMRWDYMDKCESLFDKYKIKPLLGVIPINRDPELLKYPRNDKFWERVISWKNKGWEIAMHGCHHLYTQKSYKKDIFNYGGNSEFYGLDYSEQLNKIKTGSLEFTKRKIPIRSFFAPNHNYDKNTLKALKEDGIKIIIDGYGLFPYFKYELLFIPNFSIRNILTIWYSSYANTYNYWESHDLQRFEKFLENYHNKIKDLDYMVSIASKNYLQSFTNFFVEKTLKTVRIFK